MEDKLSTFLHTVFPSDSSVRPAQKNNGGKRCLCWEKCKRAPSWIPAGCLLTSWQSTKKFWHWCVSNSRGILFSISNKWLFNQQECHRILIMWRCDAAAAKHREPDQEIQKSVCFCHQSKCVKCPKVKNCIEWSGTVGLCEQACAGKAGSRDLQASQLLLQFVAFVQRNKWSKMNWLLAEKSSTKFLKYFVEKSWFVF